MQSVAPRTVSCPKCGQPVIWQDESRYRPFCSARCKGIDLGAWASGDYAIPVVATENDPDTLNDAEPPN